ncbi:NUDIX domain-containing protein, partial [Streptomyces sp. A73]|nr:NUDIX domain-containing protein [Streptomyces sp. A73]
ALDTLHEKAPESARRRFARMFRPPVDEVQPQALRVAIAGVVRASQVLLVCRRGDGALSWQFPAGMIKPGASSQVVTVQETH